MSLTSLLASDRALAARLGALVPSSSVVDVSSLPLRAPPLTTHYPLVGTAFDYLFRFEVQRRNHEAVVKPWVADHAVALARMGSTAGGPTVLRWPPGVDRNHLVRMYDESLSAAKVAHSRYIGLSNPTNADVQGIAEQAIRLAKLDPIFRAGYLDSDPNAVDSKDIQDLVALLEIVPLDRSMSICGERDVLLNPTFGSFSQGIGGADADFLAGGTLVDIKTTKNPQLRPYLAQIVGYAMLAEAFRAREMPKFPEVRSIGIYYSRQGHLEVMSYKAVRSAADYPGAVEDLLGHCSGEPLTLIDVMMGERSASTGGTKRTNARTKGKKKSKGPPLHDSH